MKPKPAQLTAALLLVVLAAALLLLFARPRLNTWPITNPHPRGSRVIAFGDSLTAGYRVAPGESYPDHLSGLLGRPVVNRGLAGETTADALRRLERDVLDEDPRVVLVCLGANDMLRRLSAEEQFANLRAIIRRIQERGALVVLLGTEGLEGLPDVDYGARFRALAEETGAVYVPDILDGILWDRSLMRDRFHPNGRGNRRVAERLAGEAGDWLRR